MANVFGILTAIVLALSAFVALKNKARYEANIVSTNEQKTKLVANQGTLTAKQEVLAALPAETSGVNAEVEKLTNDETAQNKTNAGLTEQVTTKSATIAANKEKLDGIREKTEKTGNLQELASKMRATNAELAELTASTDTANARLANLTAQNSATDSQVASAKTRFESFAGGQSLTALNTRIRSIYPNWGFVTLAAGNNAGVVANSTLNVVRGGETIAQLLVTAVETGSASASIVPDSLAPDATLMVGDRVVPGIKASKTPGN